MDVKMQNLRHEWKHEINLMDMYVIRQRLAAVAKSDSHVRDGTYTITSLYFDNLEDRALREKVDGVNMREKFRIRYYNHDQSYISLEKKSKINGLCEKEMVNITKEEAQKIIDGDTDFFAEEKDRPLITELIAKMKWEGIRPKTIVEYDREPYVYAPGNVRVTFDYNIRTGIMSTDLFGENAVTVPAGDAPIILEVKWDEFLPGIIKDAVTVKNRHATAFSKYAACRVYM